MLVFIIVIFPCISMGIPSKELTNTHLIQEVSTDKFADPPTQTLYTGKLLLTWEQDAARNGDDEDVSHDGVGTDAGDEFDYNIMAEEAHLIGSNTDAYKLPSSLFKTNL